MDRYCEWNHFCPRTTFEHFGFPSQNLLGCRVFDDYDFCDPSCLVQVQRLCETSRWVPEIRIGTKAPKCFPLIRNISLFVNPCLPFEPYQTSLFLILHIVLLDYNLLIVSSRGSVEL